MPQTHLPALPYTLAYRKTPVLSLMRYVIYEQPHIEKWKYVLFFYLFQYKLLLAASLSSGIFNK